MQFLFLIISIISVDTVQNIQIVDTRNCMWHWLKCYSVRIRFFINSSLADD